MKGHSHRRPVSPALGLLWAAALLGETPGPQVATYRSTVDGTDQSYSLYVPPNYDPSRAYPLVIGLHGAFSNHRLNLRRLFGKGALPGETEAEASRYFPKLKEVDFLVASPSARGTMGYRGIAERDVMDVLADIRGRFHVDEDRIYLAGLSMGGGGALWLGLTLPGLWAGIAVVCPENAALSEDYAGNALNLPVALFHGVHDPVVPVGVSRAWAQRWKTLGVPVRFTEFPDARHNAWDLAFRDGALFDWFGPLRRNRSPERVLFQTRMYKYSSAYWVSITGLVPGELASVDARFTGPNRISIETNGVRGLTLAPAHHPFYKAGEPATVTLDGQTLRTMRLEFRRNAGRWSAAPYQPQPGDKRAGLEGPILDAVSAHHLYVYGTLDHPAPGEAARRQAQAVAAAQWSGAKLRPQVKLQVLADRDVPAAEAASANLVLFGTRETNSLIARYAPILPLHLDASAADYGLFYVWPEGNRYLLVNSGLPFYTGAGRIRRGDSTLLESPYALIETLGDFILFRGSLENTLVEGLFNERWRLSPGARAWFERSGAIGLSQ